MSEANETAEAVGAEVPLDDGTIGVVVPEEPAAAAIEDFGPDLLDRVWQANTREGKGALRAGPIVKRKRRTFVMMGSQCAPDLFTDPATGDYIDFKITMQSLTSTEEVEAIGGVTNPGQIPSLLAKRSLYAVNGKPITPERRDFLWEALGQQGRQVCLVAFGQIGSASMAAMGKLASTISVD